MASPLDTSGRQQTTLAKRARVAGFGFWSGRDVELEFRPTEADTGIVFVREDLPATPRIAARADLRVDVPRRTNLTSDSATVEMVEHVVQTVGLQGNDWNGGNQQRLPADRDPIL